MDVSRDISFIETFRMAGRPLGNGVPDNVVPDNMAQHKLRIVRTLMEYGMSRYGAEKLAEEVIAAAKSSAADGLDYHLKFADRSPFDRLQALCRPGETALLTVGDLITDTTFTNIVCEDSSGALLTPASPLLQGTMRQHLLDSGLLRKADIRPEDLPGFTRIHLINAMNGLGDLTVAANSISHT